MKVAACFLCKDEIDIIEVSMAHILPEVDEVWVMDDGSTDGTLEYLMRCEEHNLHFHLMHSGRDPEHKINQPAMIQRVVAEAGARGAEWILPCDVDEFWYAKDGRTIKEALTDWTYSHKLYVESFQHWNWDYKFTDLPALHKCCFRFSPGVQIAWGNHDCSLPGGSFGPIAIREIMYRGYDHFVSKALKWTNAFSDDEIKRGTGVHHTSVAAKSERERELEWQKRSELSVMFDPIPSRQNLGSASLGGAR